MGNRILHKHFFIKKDNAIYCGKCGKKQLQDNFNLKKHASACGFETETEARVFRDGQDYAYALKESEDGSKLCFYVFSYNLKLRPGFTDRYCGALWKKVFTAAFEKGSRIVKEKGLYNVDMWMKKMVDQQNIPYLSSMRDTAVLSGFFSDILSIESYGAFLDIYRNKGYGNKWLLHDDELPNVFENAEGRGFTGAEWTAVKPVFVLEDIKGEPVFHIKFMLNGRNVAELLVSDQYARANCCFATVIRMALYSSCNAGVEVRDEDIDRFDSAYPSFMLKSYIKSGGKNIFIPLLSANYNKCMELLYKAGVPALAEIFGWIKENNELVMYKNNLREIFGLPAKTLKKISSSAFAKEDGIFRRLADIYREQPQYLSLEHYESASLHFLTYQNVARQKNFQYDRSLSLPEMDGWTDKELFQTLKYLNSRKDTDGNPVDWTTYRDYVGMCIKLNEFVYGKWPKNLNEAHDIASELYFEKMNREKQELFRETVFSDFYRSFLPSAEEIRASDMLKTSPYTITAPEKAYDLVRESAQMHNCVKTYIDKVCMGNSLIFFLRAKSNVSKSLCTIEVSPSGSIVQVKMPRNQRPTDAGIKGYIKEWAKVKNLKSDCYDMR